MLWLDGALKGGSPCPELIRPPSAIWPPLGAAVFMAAIGLYAWRRRDVPGAKPFVAISVFAILWLLGIILEAARRPACDETRLVQVPDRLMVAAVAPVTCFVLDYAYPGRWLTRRNLVLLCFPPLLFLLLMVTDDSQLIWRRLEVGPDGSVVANYAPAGAILVAYGLGLVLLYAAVFPCAVHPLAAASLAGGADAVRTDRQPRSCSCSTSPACLRSSARFTVVAILLPWTMYAIALFGFRILDPLPAARTAALEQMREGMVVFDADGRYVSLNPAAERIIGVRGAPGRGKTWQHCCAPLAMQLACPPWTPRGASRRGAETELPEYDARQRRRRAALRSGSLGAPGLSRAPHGLPADAARCDRGEPAPAQARSSSGSCWPSPRSASGWRASCTTAWARCSPPRTCKPAPPGCCSPGARPPRRTNAWSAWRA